MAFPFARRSAAVLLLLAPLAAGCDHTGTPLAGRASDEWVRSYTLQDGGEFQIVGADGSIDVEGGSGPSIEVKAERVARAANDASAQQVPSRIRITEDVSPDKIVLRNEGLGGVIIGIEVAVNFHVTVPASTRLRLHTANGGITVANVSGTVVASTTSGAVVGKALSGGVEARSTNGRIAMDLAAVGRDPIDLRTTNGVITLALPASANANVDATVTNGSIDVTGLSLELTGEQSKRRMRGRLNDGGAPVQLTSTNGSIRITGAPAATQ